MPIILPLHSLFYCSRSSSANSGVGTFSTMELFPVVEQGDPGKLEQTRQNDKICMNAECVYLRRDISAIPTSRRCMLIQARLLMMLFRERKRDISFGARRRPVSTNRPEIRSLPRPEHHPWPPRFTPDVEQDVGDVEGLVFCGAKMFACVPKSSEVRGTMLSGLRGPPIQHLLKCISTPSVRIRSKRAREIDVARFRCMSYWALLTCIVRQPQ